MSANPKNVVLQYADNNCYVNAVSVEEAEEKHQGFFVDIERNEWGFGEEKFKIGKSRRDLCDKSRRYGVIGVYRTDEIDQLDSMVRAATEAVKPHGSIFDD